MDRGSHQESSGERGGPTRKGRGPRSDGRGRFQATDDTESVYVDRGKIRGVSRGQPMRPFHRRRGFLPFLSFFLRGISRLESYVSDFLFTPSNV